MAISPTVASQLTAALTFPGAESQDALLEISQAALVGLLPPEFRASCVEMLANWGAAARNTERWTVRELHRTSDAKGLTVVLAFRCGSKAPSFAQAFDERLAVLHLAGDLSDLRLIPFAKDCADCSELYQLDFAQSFKLERGRIEQLRASSSTENPCCAGTWLEQRSQMIFLLLPEAKTLLSLNAESKLVEHSEGAADQTTTCHADLKYGLDDSGNLVQFSAETSCVTNGLQSQIRSELYQWNPATRLLDMSNVVLH